MQAPTRPLMHLSTCLALAAALVSQATQAGEHEHNRRVPLPQIYVQECASCHVAYPAGMLPAASWRRLMSGLDKHFGTNATLDEQDLRFISQWLMTHADTRNTTSPPVPQDRITRTDWFVREHRHIEPTTWRLPSVRSASNCIACHTAADQGSFRERELRMPAGLSASQRSAWDD